MAEVATGQKSGVRRPRLGHEAVVAAAEALVDEHGYDELTMTSLAAALDTRVSTLYNHVDEPRGPALGDPDPGHAAARAPGALDRDGPHRHRRDARAERGVPRLRARLPAPLQRHDPHARSTATPTSRPPSTRPRRSR